jgi:uncharacterized protein YjbI with pentapeptide repeats
MLQTNLRDEDLSNARLIGAKLQEADLTGAHSTARPFPEQA